MNGELNKLAEECHEYSVRQGFWGDIEQDSTMEIAIDLRRNFGEIIANFHSEISEAWEDYTTGRGMNEIYYEDKYIHRIGIFDQKPGMSTGFEINEEGIVTHDAFELVKKPCGIPIEFADLIIRVLDACGAYGIDIEEAIQEKRVYNETREFMHGKKA